MSLRQNVGGAEPWEITLSWRRKEAQKKTARDMVGGAGEKEGSK